MHQPNERQARKRKIRQIQREAEQKKALLQVLSPSFWRNPKFYFAVIFFLAGIAAAIFKATDRAVARREAESPVLRADRHVNVLAEALGRYHFHTGQYPTADQGLAALVRDPKSVPGWDGPYINQLRRDPWGTRYRYSPPGEAGALPRVCSCGPDRIEGTADDIIPIPERFDPGTEWTNGWVSADQRMPGVWVLSELKEQGGRDGE